MMHSTPKFLSISSILAQRLRCSSQLQNHKLCLRPLLSAIGEKRKQDFGEDRKSSMGSKFASCSFLLFVALVVQNSRTNSALDDHHGHLQRMMMKHEDHEHPSSVIDPSEKIFFTINDLKAGKRMPFYFSIKDPSTIPHLLPREEADSIPFSSAKLPELLQLFSFAKDSPQAKAMEYTLTQCELQPLKGETKFCANSLESMLDSARNFFGLGTKFRALTTKHHRLSRATHVPFQNYTVLGVPREIPTPKMVACHTMPYPYAVFYCHGQESDRKVFELWLKGENGERVDAYGVCHMDTSQWDPDHVAFHVLKTRPGASPVCHVFPADNPIWVASSPTMHY